jgi:hypothetical protein
MPMINQLMLVNLPTQPLRIFCMKRQCALVVRPASGPPWRSPTFVCLPA